MKKRKLKYIASFLILLLIAGSVLTGCGSEAPESGNDPAAKAQEYLYSMIPEPYCDSVGGEWTVTGLLQGGYPVSEDWLQTYTNSVEEVVSAADGVLNTRTGYKYTEYSRIILGWTAAGKDPRDVAGYNFLEKLSDLDNVCRQGINGPIWALIAFDCGGYETTGNATRQALIEYILQMQLSDGGWNLTGETSDADLTAMALTALAPYYAGDEMLCGEVDDETLKQVETAVTEGLACLSSMQQEDGSFTSWGEATSESSAQAVTALSSLGIDAAADEAFVKEGGSALDALLRFQQEDGGFAHVQDGETNMMATEQAVYALAAYDRMTEGKTRLFDMRK